ncbi:hypothetical protein HDE_03590 [Halotydeus destructor]|nr:hypothetical protein HDE_03590 [Halotydeus destructor]
MKLSLFFLSALAVLVCFAAVEAANPLKIIKISKVVRSGVNKFHDAIGSRHGRSVDDSEVIVDRAARSTAGKWFNRVKDGVKSRVGRSLHKGRPVRPANPFKGRIPQKPVTRLGRV